MSQSRSNRIEEIQEKLISLTKNIDSLLEKEQVKHAAIIFEGHKCISKITTNRPNNTQNQHPHHKGWLNSSASFLANQGACKSASNQNTERRKAVTELLHRQIRDINNLVRVQDQSFPRRSRKYDPILVYNLIYHVKTLLGTLDAYVFPLLEQTDSNKQ